MACMIENPLSIAFVDVIFAYILLYFIIKRHLILNSRCIQINVITPSLVMSKITSPFRLFLKISQTVLLRPQVCRKVSRSSFPACLPCK